MAGFGLDQSSFDLARASTSPARSFVVIHKENVDALSTGEKEFALLDESSARILAALRALGAFRLQAIILHDNPLKNDNTKASKVILKVAVNIYGPKESSKELGALLTSKGQYLQHPEVFNPNIKYQNPHYCTLPNETDLNRLVQPRQHGRESKTTDDKTLSAVSTIIDSLHAVSSDWDVPMIHGLLTPLLRYYSP